MSSEQRDAAAQMRAVAADIEDVVMRLNEGEPWTQEDSTNLWAGAESLLDWANRLHPEWDDA